MRKNLWWIMEIAIIICLFAVIPLGFNLFGDNSSNCLLIRFILNYFGQIALLFFAIYKINRICKKSNLQLYSCFNNAFSLKDLANIIFVVIIGPVTYRLINSIEVIHVFNKDALIFNTHISSGFQSWIWFLLIAIYIIVGVLAEELYFRCYLFEVQYQLFKKYAWIVNGFSWSIYHLFTPTNFLAILPTCLMYSYVYQRRRNIWTTISIHLINNFIAFYPVLKTYLK